MLTIDRTRHPTRPKVLRKLLRIPAHRVAPALRLDRPVDSMAHPVVLLRPRQLQPPRNRSQRIDSC